MFVCRVLVGSPLSVNTHTVERGQGRRARATRRRHLDDPGPRARLAGVPVLRRCGSARLRQAPRRL
eukprot:6039179-Prymnesium_polylepis.1